MKIIIVIKYKNKYNNIKIFILYYNKKYNNLINTLYLSVNTKKKKELFKIFKI